MRKNLMVVAGESSGDMHAADVIAALREEMPALEVWGIGGEKMRAAGVQTICDIKEMDVLGFVEVLKRYPFFKRVFRTLLAEAERRRPDAIFLIDYPGFNLRLARELKRRGFPVYYYVCPQVWAWNRGRIPKMAQRIDRLMVIFPFEVEVFRGVDLQVDFVGHPMVDELRAVRAAAPQPLPWRGEKKVALLPGSRRQEIRYILEPLLRAAARMERENPALGFMIPVPARREKMVRDWVRSARSVPRNLSIVVGQSREVLKQADAAFVASGTATLEAALLGCPTVLVYRGSWLNELFVRLLIRIPWLGIANVISNREIMPERLQRDMTPEKLSEALTPLLDSTPQRTAMLRDFKGLEEQLGCGAPAGRVAAILLEALGDRAD